VLNLVVVREILDLTFLPPCCPKMHSNASCSFGKTGDELFQSMLIRHTVSIRFPSHSFQRLCVAAAHTLGAFNLSAIMASRAIRGDDGEGDLGAASVAS